MRGFTVVNYLFYYDHINIVMITRSLVFTSVYCSYDIFLKDRTLSLSSNDSGYIDDCFDFLMSAFNVCQVLLILSLCSCNNWL